MWNKQESGEDITSNSVELSKGTDCSPILAIKNKLRDFLVVKLLRLCASSARSTGWIPGEELRSPYAIGQKKKNENEIIFRGKKSKLTHTSQNRAQRL